MRIEIVPDDIALARSAAGIVCDAVQAKPDARLGLPTGDTPIRTYAELARRADAGEIDLGGVTGYAVDEFCAGASVPGTNIQFYREHLRIGVRTLRCPDPAAADPDAAIRAFSEELRAAGGLDLCLLGIGRNGHIAFNEPGSSRSSPARVVELSRESREAHAAAFGSIDAVPARGMTLGVADLLASRRIVLLARGGHKARILRAAIAGPQTADVPASWLQSHPDVVVLADRAAAEDLPATRR